MWLTLAADLASASQGENWRQTCVVFFIELMFFI